MITILNYTIPKLIRELKRGLLCGVSRADYTIPKLIRELKRYAAYRHNAVHYTIPKLIRELKLIYDTQCIGDIIPYQNS